MPNLSGDMAMLRVSSYRKLFEDQRWSPTGGLRLLHAGRYRASARCADVDKCGCDKLDFVTVKALNEEGLDRFVQDRTAIALLNDRLVKLIELAHCLEEENVSLECQISDLEENLKGQNANPSITSTVVKPEYSLDAVVERLCKQRDEILCDTEELKEKLECHLREYDKAAHQRILIQQEQQDVAEVVDAVTAECLARRDQVAVYEEQLANQETQHKREAESLLQPDERAPGAAAIRFGSLDITAALDVKKYYCQLAQSLQLEFEEFSTGKGDGKKVEVGRAAGSLVYEPTEMDNVDEMKTLILDMQKELNELEKSYEELLDEVEEKRAAHMDEVAELEFTVTEMKQHKTDLKFQMREQCEEYKGLLHEKMARVMEIVAYRSLVEEEELRLCSL